MNANIAVERADNALRKLRPGFVYQLFSDYSFVFITKSDFASRFNNSLKLVQEAQERWENKILAYINEQAPKKGLYVWGVRGQLIEEPNEDKFHEKLYWEQKDLAFVWAVWAYFKGPVPQEVYTEGDQRLFGFWPADIAYWGDYMPDAANANKLSAIAEGGDR